MISGGSQGGTQIEVFRVLVIRNISRRREMDFYQKIVHHDVFFSFLKRKTSKFVEFITATFLAWPVE